MPNKVSYSINGFRRNLAEDLKELKVELEAVFEEYGIDNQQEIQNIFNSLACSSNSFNCVHAEGFDMFDNLSSDPEVPLFDN